MRRQLDSADTKGDSQYGQQQDLCRERTIMDSQVSDLNDNSLSSAKFSLLRGFIFPVD